jgi:hypothetical protein
MRSVFMTKNLYPRGHLITMNIPLRKKGGYYASSIKIEKSYA